MTEVKNISLGVIHGIWDSIRGMTLLFHIDAEIHRLNIEKESQREQRIIDQQRRSRRSPSPTPSSASAFARDEYLIANQFKSAQENPDERNFKTLSKKRNSKPKGEKKIAKQVLKCCLLNGGFTWLSIIVFEQLLLPMIRYLLILCYGQSQELHTVWSYLQSILSIIFGMMWVMPIFLLSKIVSSLWFADIANAAYRIRKGQPQMIHMHSVSKLVADFCFSILVQIFFLIQSMLVSLLPIRFVGDILCYLHLSLLYSLYCFEYKWFNMGWELHRRLTYIENNWPYFIGFGIPLTILTNMSNSIIVSSCIFSIFFPLFILSGNEAKPIVGTSGTSLRLFSPVIFFANLFFNRSGKIGINKKNNIQLPSAVQQNLPRQQRSQRSQSREGTSTFRYKQPPAPFHCNSTMPKSTDRIQGLQKPLVPTQIHHNTSY